MKKIIEYKIEWGNSTSDLCEKVRSAMQFGWQPLGGASHDVATTLGEKRDILIQTMVQYEK